MGAINSQVIGRTNDAEKGNEVIYDRLPKQQEKVNVGPPLNKAAKVNLTRWQIELVPTDVLSVSIYLVASYSFLRHVANLFLLQL